jgi:hypothetical protein
MHTSVARTDAFKSAIMSFDQMVRVANNEGLFRFLQPERRIEFAEMTGHGFDNSREITSFGSRIRESF